MVKKHIPSVSFERSRGLGPESWMGLNIETVVHTEQISSARLQNDNFTVFLCAFYR